MTDRVVEAMAREMAGCDPNEQWPSDAYWVETSRVALSAASDPALGEDRLVRLGDVVEALDGIEKPWGGCDPSAADFLLERFGEGLPASPTASETGAET